MSQQYSLRWNNHQPNFISMFTTLLNTQTLVDVTLSADGKQLKAHKIVLSACSTYFQALFVDNPSSHPIVILKDVSYTDLRTMVDFMYCGEVNITEEQLPKMLETAKLLKIKGLTEMPESASLMRSQGTSVDFQSPGDSGDSQRQSASPSASPSAKRRRRRKSSTGSTCLNMIPEERRNEEPNVAGEVAPCDSVTLGGLPQQRRLREYQDERNVDNVQQAMEPHNLNFDAMTLEANQANQGMPQGQWSMMEHTYPRYANACIGGVNLQPDPGMYMNNMIAPHMNMEGINEYAQSGSVAGAGPSSAPEAHIPQEPLQPSQPTPPMKPRRRRTTNPQAEEKFQRAIEAVRDGGIGFCKAARMFGVNNRTLWLEFRKRGYPNSRRSIKSRIKREHPTPPPDHKEEPPRPDQQMALLCSPHTMPVGFIETRPLDFPLQGMAHNSPLNLLGVNFNSMQ